MIGWNINDFTACIMCLIRPEEYSYQELTEVLEQILYNNVTTNLREYCGGSPVVIGYLEPQKFTKIPNLVVSRSMDTTISANPDSMPMIVVNDIMLLFNGDFPSLCFSYLS